MFIHVLLGFAVMRGLIFCTKVTLILKRSGKIYVNMVPPGVWGWKTPNLRIFEANPGVACDTQGMDLHGGSSPCRCMPICRPRGRISTLVL